MLLLSILLLTVRSLTQTSAWTDLGCIDDGFLSASHFTEDITEKELSSFLQSSHPIAQSSCFGSHEDEEQYSPPEQFHLFWECYDVEEACLLPSVNVRALQTLLHFHPTSKVTIWSNSLQQSLFHSRITSSNVELKRYSEQLFHSLPTAAEEASLEIPKFFESNVESHSHFSDLFRLAVLWKYGGIYVDFDSLWVNSVGSLSSTDAGWIPLTEQKIDGFPLIDGKGFLEGGTMKLPRHSEFALRALESFPKYNAQVAECWACVGPKHLTNVYIQMLQESEEPLPSLIDSSLVFGDSYYRANLDEMYAKMDISVLLKAASSNAVAFHLFTSSGERFPRPSSVIEYLFKISDLESDSTTQYVPLGALSQRRMTQETVNSVNYDSTVSTSSPSFIPTSAPSSSPTMAPTSSPTMAPSSSPTMAPTSSPTATKITEIHRFDVDYQAEIAGNEEAFKAKWKSVAATKCISLAEGSVIVEHEGTEVEMQSVRDSLQASGGIDLSPEFRFYSHIAEDDSTEAEGEVKTTSSAVEAAEALSEEDGGEDPNMILLIFYALGGVLVVIGFYCIYRVWKGPKSKKLKHLTDSHVQYIQNDRSSAAFANSPYQPPKRPNKFMQTGGYQKREPQSSYINGGEHTVSDTGGYLIDGGDELHAYAHKPNHGDADAFVNASLSKQNYYDYEAGVIGGGRIEDAYNYKRDPRAADIL